LAAVSDTFYLNVTAVNDAPIVAHAIADQISTEDTAWSFVIPANTFSDVDGDALTYTASLADGSILPGWLSFNASSRTFSGTPPANFNGQIALTVTASDGLAADSDTFALNVTPVSDAPMVSSNAGGDTATVNVAENTTAVTTVTATDPDAGQPLSYSIGGGADASKFTINAHTGALSFVTAPNFEAPTDAGHNNVYDVIVQTWDSYGDIDTQALSVSVQNAADGNADILWQNNINGTPALWQMDGLSPTRGAVLPNPGPAWHVVDAGDFNGDGNADIVWQGSDGTPAMWLMDDDKPVWVGAVGPFNPGPNWEIKGTGDFNGDGRSDILWQGSDGTPAIWLMDGASAVSVGVAGSFNPGPSWEVKGAADVNGDGNSDILWQGSNGTPAVWLMDGLSATAVAGLPNLGADWHIIA
jgi:hypothetical protein